MDAKIKAFLDLIALSEGTSTSPATKNDGYDVVVTGIAGPDATTDKPGPEIFADYADHPFARGRRPKLFELPDCPPHRSTASGRYQVLLRYWRAYQTMLNLPDFSPASQDAVAIRQIQERGALLLIASDEIEEAIKACSNIWASLPGNSYRQPQHTMEALLTKYNELSAPEVTA